MLHNAAFHQGLQVKQSSGTEINHNWEILTCDPLKHKMNYPILIAFICVEKSIRTHLGLN